MKGRPAKRSLVRLHVAAVVAASFAEATRAVAGGPLPVPCVLSSCGPSSPSFVTYGKATATESGNTLNITQSSNLATLNWSSFNIGAGNSVQFRQPTSSSIALNRIYQQSPSAIFGELTANGQIYLINPNGMLFGKTAQVNVAGLIASSLGMSDSTFENGILTPIENEQAALQSQGSAADVIVQQGAQISAPGGRILLAGANVQNAGSLSAPDGQVILAAGQSVYLQASSDPSLRGLVVEVDQGGTAWNQLTGEISADRGNITLVGLAVNQDGRLSATTSVAANGSVRLEAADNVTFGGNSVGDQSFDPTTDVSLGATQGGTLTLGPHSSIEIQPEYSSTATEPSDSTQLQSQITLVGQQVFLDGPTIAAHDGNLQVVAAANPSANGVGVSTDGNSAAQIRIHAGTSIDLSGSSAELPMSANILELQLHANELADDPTQRNGPLYGQTVYIDMRTGTSIVGATALQEAEQAVPYSVAYRTTAGGSASFESEGDIVVSPGATINVSGGETVYSGGVVQTTQLVGANGQLYDIGTANPLLAYMGVMNPTFTETFNKWGVQTVVPSTGAGQYEPGYVQGASAGSVTFAAPAMALQGTLLGSAVNGPYQLSGSGVASGGTLILGLARGLPNTTGAPFEDFLTPPIEFVAQAAPVVALDGAPILPQTLQLPISYLTSGGFQRTEIYGDSTVTIPAGVPLNMLPGSSLQIEAPRIDVFSNITSSGGSVQLESDYSYLFNTNPTPLPVRAGVEIGDDVTIDVRGQWVNDSPDLGPVQVYQPTLQNGGQIDLSLAVTGGELVLGNDVTLHASGGAYVSGTNGLTGGTGGSISILASPLDSALQIGSGLSLDAYGVDGAEGGSFTLSAPRISIVSGADWRQTQRVDDLLSPGGVLSVGNALFSDDGFSSVALTATGAVVAGASTPDVLTVQTGTTIAATSQTLELDGNYLLRPSGGTIAGFAQPTTLPEAERTPSQVLLSVLPQAVSATPARLDVEAGSTISTDPGGSIELVGIGGVYVDGTLRSPGGTITLQAPSPSLIDPNYAAVDPGYEPDLVVELGSRAVLDVSGAAVTTPNGLGLTLGAVLNGGSVNLFGDRGAVITDPGSIIDIAGGSAVLDEPVALNSATYLAQRVGSSAGTLTVRSGVGASLGGTLEAEPGAGNYGKPAGGTLAVQLSESDPIWFTVSASAPTPYPTTPFDIQLVSATEGAPQSPQATDLAVLGISNLASSGIAALQLLSENTIEFSSSRPLVLGSEAIFDAPVLSVDSGVNAVVSANYLQLNNSQINAPSPSALLSGTGTLRLNAQEIDLVGNEGVSGAKLITLDSSGDVLLQGVAIGLEPNEQGSLTLAGDLTIDAARIYPATATDYSIQTLNPGNTVTLGQTNPSPGVPLSAGGSVAISADDIVSSGTLIAPFGSITLTATTSLDLEPGSLTSVSGAGALIPYGQTQLGQQQWVNTGNGSEVIDAIPARDVQLQAPALTIAKGATVDLQGGGELYAYEWVPGTGGTTNALAPGTIPGLYAIVPSMRGQFAPYDPGQMAGSPLQPGASIYLSGGDGLAAGVYPLLPASYALLPGAYLVQVQPGFNGIVPGQSANLANGTPVVAGYLTFGTTQTHGGLYQGVALWPGSYGQQLAEYDISYATTFFSAAAAAAGQPAPNLPADAGQLSLAVEESLNVAGTVLGNLPDSKGKSAAIDVSATNIEITAANADDPLPAGTVGLSSAVIDSWQAGELIIGGQASAAQTGSAFGTAAVQPVNIAVQADSVTVGKGAQLEASQVILVANQSIDVQSGASLISSSGAAGAAAPAQAATVTPFYLTTAAGAPANGAALLAVSDSVLPIVQRAGAATSLASIDIEQGATVASRGAIAVDAPGQVTLAGTISGPGASWLLASSSIGFVGSGSSADSLQVNSTLQAALQRAGTVELSSLGAINLYVPVALGGESGAGAATLDSLTLAAQSLNDLAGSGTATFTAQTLTVEGAIQSLGGATSTASPPPAGSGTIVFNAQQFNVGTGMISIGDVAQTDIVATGLFAAQGASGTANGIISAGNLSIVTPVLSAGNGAAAQIQAPSGTLSIAAGPGKAVLPAGYLGGELDFSANTISDSGNVVVPSGVVTMAAAEDLDLSSGAVISTAGQEVGIVNQTVGTPGGYITLTAGGNLNVAAGSSLNVSGAGGTSAGTIALNSVGATDLAGSLSGQSTSSAYGGQFFLDAGSLTQSLSPLADALLAGGFDDALSVRVHTGDLTLAAGHELLANSVILTADTGTVDIEGTVSATGAGLRGEIGLFGGTAVLIGPNAELLANSNGSTGIGGNIELGTGSSGSVTLDGGSTVSALGAAGDGTLLVRAPLVGGDAIAATLNGGSGMANLSQLSQIIVEPVITETADEVTAGTVTAADWSRIQADVTNDMNTALAPITSALDGELSAAALPALLIRPAVDVVGTGPLTLAAAPDFATWRYNNQPVDLTIRSAGDLTVDASFSDGFSTATVPGQRTPVTVLTTNADGSAYDSADIRLVAGADANSPNPLATLSVGNPVTAAAATPAALTIASGTSVRTGTGEIDLVAAGDVVFGQAGVGTPGAEVYTGGLPGAAYQTVRLSDSVFNFPTAGGNVVVNAGGSIIGALIPQSTNIQDRDAGPSPTSWLISEGGPLASTTQWGVDLTAYQSYGWNVGSLGGGDVSVRAGADIENLSVAASDSYFTSGAGTPTHQLSGGLQVAAGGNIGTGEFYEADGTSLLQAGGAFNSAPGSGGAGNLIALADAQVSVDARLGVQIDSVVNPTTLTQAAKGLGLSTGFFTYTASSALDVQSTTGEVNLAGTQASTLLGLVANGYGGTGEEVYPATLLATAVSGKLVLTDATLYASSNGQLRLLAGEDIDYSGGFTPLIMSDAFLANLPGPQNPGLGALQDLQNSPFASGAHVNDTNPAVVVAGQDIDNLSLSVPKATQIIAGRDILDLSFAGQNLNPGDITLISAGRDIIDPVSLANTYELITVGGPGQVDIVAGRNFDLGLSSGLQTTGNLLNPDLPSTSGASLNIMAGLGQSPDYSGFLTKIVDPSGIYQAQLVSYVEQVSGESNLSFAEAEKAFGNLAQDVQSAFLNQVFFDQLQTSGLDETTVPGAGYTLGYAAIDALFPNSRTAVATGPSPYAGNVSLSFSKIYTLSGGDISILVPGGSLGVGLATVPAALQGAVTRAPSDLGIVAEGPGSVDIYTQGDVNVNASRVFTLGGGNILIWSDEGSIDAGKGAKTSVSAPPPQVTVAANGTITETFYGAVAGSGIRTIQALPGIPAGNVNLIAPEGTVNAGDAGIGAAGNINIAAQQVLGLNNIQFGGTATGVPAQVSDIGVALSGAASLASSATNTATSSADEEARKNAAAAPRAQAAVSWLDVFVIGMGEENCSSEDVECLKRQKKQ